MKGKDRKVNKKNGSGFIGFSSFASTPDPTPSAQSSIKEDNSQMKQPLNFYNGDDPEWTMVLKKLGKKDEITKRKALETFCLLVSNKATEKNTSEGGSAFAPIVGHWVYLYQKLAFDADRRVRELTQVALQRLIQNKLKKELRPYMLWLFPTWWVSRFDTYAPEAAKIASASMESAFPILEKKNQLIQVARKSIVDLVVESTDLSVKAIADKVGCSLEEAKEHHYSQYVSTCLRGLAGLIKSLGSIGRKMPWIKDLLSMPAFWKLLQSKHSIVRRSSYEVVGAISQHWEDFKALDTELRQVVASAVFGSIGEKDPCNHPMMFEMLLQVATVLPDLLSDSLKKPNQVFFPRLWSLMKHSMYGSALSYRYLLPLLASMPSEFLYKCFPASRAAFAMTFLQNIWSGLQLSVAKELMKALFECTEYIFQNQEEEHLMVITEMIEKLCKQVLLDKMTSCEVVYLFWDEVFGLENRLEKKKSDVVLNLFSTSLWNSVSEATTSYLSLNNSKDDAKKLSIVFKLGFSHSSIDSSKRFKNLEEHSITLLEGLLKNLEEGDQISLLAELCSVKEFPVKPKVTLQFFQSDVFKTICATSCTSFFKLCRNLITFHAGTYREECWDILCSYCIAKGALNRLANAAKLLDYVVDKTLMVGSGYKSNTSKNLYAKNGEFDKICKEILLDTETAEAAEVLQKCLGSGRSDMLCMPLCFPETFIMLGEHCLKQMESSDRNSVLTTTLASSLVDFCSEKIVDELPSAWESGGTRSQLLAKVFLYSCLPGNVFGWSEKHVTMIEQLSVLAKELWIQAILSSINSYVAGESVKISTNSEWCSVCCNLYKLLPCIGMESYDFFKGFSFTSLGFWDDDSEGVASMDKALHLISELLNDSTPNTMENVLVSYFRSLDLATSTELFHSMMLVDTVFAFSRYILDSESLDSYTNVDFGNQTLATSSMLANRLLLPHFYATLGKEDQILSTLCELVMSSRLGATVSQKLLELILLKPLKLELKTKSDSSGMTRYFEKCILGEMMLLLSHHDESASLLLPNIILKHFDSSNALSSDLIDLIDCCQRLYKKPLFRLAKGDELTSFWAAEQKDALESTETLSQFLLAQSTWFYDCSEKASSAQLERLIKFVAFNVYESPVGKVDLLTQHAVALLLDIARKSWFCNNTAAVNELQEKLFFRVLNSWKTKMDQVQEDQYSIIDLLNTQLAACRLLQGIMFESTVSSELDNPASFLFTSLKNAMRLQKDLLTTYVDLDCPVEIFECVQKELAVKLLLPKLLEMIPRVYDTSPETSRNYIEEMKSSKWYSYLSTCVNPSTLFVQNACFGILRERISSASSLDGIEEDEEDVHDEEVSDLILAQKIIPLSLQRELGTILSNEADQVLHPGKFMLWNLFLDLYDSIPPACEEGSRKRSALGAFVRRHSLLYSVLEGIMKHDGTAARSAGNNSTNAIQERMDAMNNGLPSLQHQRFSLEYSEENVQQLLDITYYRTIRLFPVLSRQWWSDECSRKLSLAVAQYTRDCVSPLLLHEEIQRINGSEEFNADDISVKGSRVSREITASYLKDESSLKLVLRVPEDYPLHPVQVACTQRVGFSDAKMVLQLIKLTTSTDGSLVDAILLWKRNVDKIFEGVEPCPICYSVVHPKTFSPPKLSCSTCSNTYHNTCLYQWFNQSGKNKCPVCQQPFRAIMKK